MVRNYLLELAPRISYPVGFGEGLSEGGFVKRPHCAAQGTSAVIQGFPNSTFPTTL